MNLHDLVSQLIVDTKGNASGSFFQIDPHSSLGVFLPELLVCITILMLLLVRLFKGGDRIPSFLIAVIGSGLAVYCARPWELLQGDIPQRMEIFTGMLVYDSFSIYLRSLLLIFALLFAIFTWLTGIPDQEDGADIYTLVLGATLGMCLMLTANHLLMVFMAVEMASVPSYVLAGLMKGRHKGSEAALKYVVYGGGAAGVMLYGISLLAGLLNSAHLPTMAVQLAEKLPTFGSSEIMVLALGGLLLGVGLAFKLSAFPFHFWCPDVFEGAPAEVGAFLSIASKAAALGLLVRVVLGFGTLPTEIHRPGPMEDAAPITEVAVAKPVIVYTALADEAAADSAPAVPATDEPAKEEPATAEAPAKEDGTAEEPKKEEASPAEAPAQEEPAKEATAPDASAPESAAPEAPKTEEAAPVEPAHEETPHHEPAKEEQEATVAPLTPAEYTARLKPVRQFIAKLIAFIAIITCTFGNLAAYGQTNIKRLLAYSTIAHAGYMMMPVAALAAGVGVDAVGAQQAIAGLAIYIAVYLFMNLGAFACVAYLRNALHSEQIADYAGLIKRAPLTVVCFTIILFSLIGMPPLSGFVGKFAIFASLAQVYTASVAAGDAAGYLLLALIVGGLNTAICLFYYLRVVKVMTIDEEPATRTPINFSEVSLQGAFLWLVTLPTALLMISWDWLFGLATIAAKQLLS